MVSKKYLVKWVALLVLILGFLAGCAPGQVREEATPTPIPTPVIPAKPTYKVAAGDVERKLEFSARVVPLVQEELYFKVNGRVSKILALKGDQVKAGQLLAELETNITSVDVRRAQVNLEMARLNKEMAMLTNNKYSATYNLILKMKDYEIELAQLALDDLNNRISTTQLKATFDGTVLSSSLTPDKVITAYKGELVLADLRQLEVSADLTQTTMTNLQEGLPVQVFPSSRPGQALNGVLSRLPYPYGKADPAAAKVKPDSATHISLLDDLSRSSLGLGDLVRVVVILEKKSSTLWLPPQAVRKFEGRQFVVIQEENGQRRVDIKTGITTDDRVEILEGLSLGQVVLAP